MSASTLLIRADASVSIGTGHIMRCLALAQAWQDAGGQAAFAMFESTAALRSKVAAESCEVFPVSSPPGGTQDSQETIDCARKVGAQWIVVDGYPFGADYQCALKAAGLKILFVDDYGHAKRYAADLVLNQNVSANAALYAEREPHTRLLLGPKYALLRREFSPWRDWKRTISPACRQLLVMMGGSDPENISARVIEALKAVGLAELKTTIVVGGSNPHFPELQRAAAQSELNVQFVIDASNVGELMAEADLAVSAAGSTCWEICLLGLPALLIDVADNQTEVAEELHRRACAIHVGDRGVTADKLSEGLRALAEAADLRQSLSRNSRDLVDGRGAERVAAILRGPERLRVRHATPEDRQLLWTWTNDPEVREASFSTAAISWETHLEWFAQKLSDQQSLMLIAQDEVGRPVGQVRFDLDGRDAYINISLAKEKRGCGLAVLAIKTGVKELFASYNCGVVHAFVKPENTASVRTFEGAGFERVENATIRDHGALHFLISRDRF